ncbi:receptor protein kinase-like protein At4g34220 [Andrographis paniculata]|uniref:receptor protein kinase-like protein At4g34220 n=1 Tax=Andrographis paniculata TaxID=175694 RepID=UPI0021E7CA55|nr:receptor protein kinase-like protein At4g34220 [Andrographis paniculata]
MKCIDIKASSSFSLLLLLLTLPPPSHGLNVDGTLLLSFKYSILSDPLSVLHNWDYHDDTPCLWTGVTCAAVETPFGEVPVIYRVISLSLPNSNLLGVIPTGLGFLPHLTTLDLSSNFLNGTLPDSIFSAPHLQFLSLANNVISGEIPDIASKSLRILNLSDNALTGTIPPTIASLPNLGVVSLRSNYLSGNVPAGVGSIGVLDLSSNLLNGSLPDDFGGENLKYLNLSSNNLSGLLPPLFAAKIPRNASVDLSFNDLSGEIPAGFSDQKLEWFEGNSGLCGKPLKNLCSISSTISIPPNVSNSNTSSAAIAAIPRTTDSFPEPDSSSGASSTPNSAAQRGLKPSTVAAIAVAPLAGIAILAALFFCVYYKRIKANGDAKESSNSMTNVRYELNNSSESSPVTKKKQNFLIWPCLNVRKGDESSDATGSDSDENAYHVVGPRQENQNQNQNHRRRSIRTTERSLVMINGETEMEPETLLKASAYVLGTSGNTIVYKAVLQDGTAFAVRRIGESRINRMKEFDSLVKAIAKIQHPNVVRVRGFYWGDDEKLVIYDYISNGSLANVGYRKLGSSPNHLSFDTRLKIARGVARGISFIHDKKQVHGNIKPSNILLTSEMEPLISDFGVHWLANGRKSTTSTGSPTALARCLSPYHAPESLIYSRGGKQDPKWDVYSFGILLLELLTGRAFSSRELGRWSNAEDAGRALRMGDVAGREEATQAWAELGFRCASLVPQSRPSMKDAVTVLEKIPSCSY